MPTRFIKARDTNGVVSITIQKDNDEVVTTNYILMKNPHFLNGFDVNQLDNSQGNLFEYSGFRVIGNPDNIVSVFADDTDMPRSVATSFVKHVWRDYSAKLVETIKNSNGTISRYDYKLTKKEK